MMLIIQTRTFSNFEVTHVLLDTTKPFANVRAFFEAIFPNVLVRDDGQTAQYEIALGASALKGYNRATALYTPLRVLLYDNGEGGARLEYDLPSSLFAQFSDARVLKVAIDLDDALLRELSAAAG